MTIPTTKTYTFDAWVGDNRKTYTFDGVLRATRTKTYTFDAYLKKRKTYTFDSLVTDPRGSFRGIGSRVVRDALSPKYAGDTFLMVDQESQQHGQFWTGTAWTASHTVKSQESGQSRKIVVPTVGGWSAETGNPSYPFNYTDGATRRFSVDAAGTVYGNAVTFGSTSALNTNDTITLPETPGTIATPARVQTATATGTSGGAIVTSWPAATAAGNLLWVVVTLATGTGGGLGGGIVGPVGYTEAFSSAFGTVSGRSIWAYYKLNSAAGAANPSVTVTPAGYGVTVTIAEYSGIATSAAIDRTASQSGTGTTTPSTNTTALTTQNTELWLGAFALSTNSPTNPTNRFTQLSSLTGAYTADAVATSTNTAGFSVTASGTTTYAGGIATFKAAALAGVPTPPANAGTFYVADKAGVSAPYFIDDAAVPHDILSPPATPPAAKYVRTSSVQATSSAEVTIATYNIPANTLAVGTTYRLKMWGSMNAPAVPPTMNMKIKYGATALLSTGAITPTASISGKPWYWEGMVTCRATGASGSLIAGEVGTLKWASTTANTIEAGVNGLPTTVDTTATTALTATVTWSAEPAGIYMICDLAIIELVNT